MNRPPRILRHLRRAVGCLALLALLAPMALAQVRPDLSYAGTWPCAGCAARQVTLTLFGDHTFRLRMREVDARGGTVAQAHDIGRWGSEGMHRVLRGGHEAPMVFELGDDGALRLLDPQRRPVAALHDAPLRPLPAVDAVAGPMPLRGMVADLADAATLTECRTGRRWPLLIEGGHAALERAYLDWRVGGGEGPVLAALVGRFDARASEPGLAPREAIVVERFERLWPRETCAADLAARSPLVNVRWRIVEVDGELVEVAAGQREPFVLFTTDGNRVRGYGGCNSFAGRFEMGADGLQLRDLSATRMACADGGLEARLLHALQATESRRIVGDALQLSDVDGRVRVRAEALYLR
jgi:copper homeostasis protein (lipoprotein)